MAEHKSLSGAEEIDAPMSNKHASKSTRAMASSLRSLSAYDVEVSAVLKKGD
jgi:hypothetical protein